MDGHYKAFVPLSHRLRVTQALDYLVERLACDNWYVACHREHLFVVHLTRGGHKRFALCCECTSPAEKGITHESQLSALSLVALGEEPNPASGTLQELGTTLSDLGQRELSGQSGGIYPAHNP